MSLRDTLPLGTVVGEFEIRKVLGQGGFGIVYEAYEAMLDRRVALKEYFLQGFSRREEQEVHPADAESVEMFGSGMTRFIREARLLSMLNERTRADGSLVAVYRVFQANRTAFMAMKLYEGQTMRQTVLAAPDRVDEPWLVSLLQRMLDALHALHSLEGENLVHRDVSPDNIILQPDGRPVLLDFGATRKASDAQTSLIYKPGYSPIEQYTDAIKQGPWTDLYALSGVAYFAIARQSPLPAVDRYAGAKFISAAEKGAGRFSPEFLALVDHGMSIMPEQRFQTAEAMREALAELPSAHATVQARLHGGHTRATPPPTRAAGTRTALPPTPLGSPNVTATYAAPPATTPLTQADQGLVADEDTTQVHTGVPLNPADVRTQTWGPAPLPPADPTRATVVTRQHLPPPPNPRRRLAFIGAGAAALVAVGVALLIPPRDNGDAGGGTAQQQGAASQAAAASQNLQATQNVQVASEAASSAIVIADSASKPAANLPGLACTAASADWPCVLEGLAKLSSTPQGVALRISPEQVRVGEAISLDVRSRQDGLLYLLAVDEVGDAKLVQGFPNARDANNRIRAGKPVRLPRPSTWGLVAQPPTGRSWWIAVVSAEPLPANSPLAQGVTLQQAVQAFAAQQPLRLLGVADCTAGAAGCPKTLSIQPADFIIR